jgi:hypothetical protein
MLVLLVAANHGELRDKGLQTRQGVDAKVAWVGGARSSEKKGLWSVALRSGGGPRRRLGLRVAGSGIIDRTAAFLRRRVPPERRRRVAVAVGGYAVLALFGLALWLARGVSGRLWGAALAIAAVVAAPLALALVYERLSALKTPWFEIALTTATVEVGAGLAQALEEQHLTASGNPALTEPISAELSPGAATVVRVNLRSGSYW